MTSSRKARDAEAVHRFERETQPRALRFKKTGSLVSEEQARLYPKVIDNTPPPTKDSPTKRGKR